jgi:hypothetical protein
MVMDARFRQRMEGAYGDYEDKWSGILPTTLLFYEMAGLQ